MAARPCVRSPLEGDKEMRKLAHTLDFLSHLTAMYCGGLADWHHRDPLAPCGNQRQPMMKDGVRLFPVIETQLMGVCGGGGVGGRLK